MAGESFGLGEVLVAAENASPVQSVAVVARNLRDRFDASDVSFLFVDLIGQEVVRLADQRGSESGHTAERFRLRGSVYDDVLRSQRLYRESRRDGQERVLAPVTNRGDVIGLLELTVPHTDEAVRRQIGEAAHALAYIIVTDRRFTDLYHSGQRTTRMGLGSEIQHQLLPSASCCEAAEFTVACGLVPADNVGGDTYDYALDRNTLHLSITDAMGHDVDSAILATLLVGALRRARRERGDVLEQARQAHQALSHYNRGFATGQLFRVDLEQGMVQVVNAGHPRPLLLRDGEVREVHLDADLPFGVPMTWPYSIQKLELRLGDRLILITDGMREREAAALDLPALIREGRDLHPREAVRALTSAVNDVAHGDLQDDATVLCFDWNGPATTPS
ncbi:PP2C family protein-serine/threonine phosphatase [Bailinhaonella thermotolerans]|uniref:Serine/threonine-protein phosphatase n=1 Tax=Bailinhaonella thermotolerans TaxID=1070861 RepID=A0A3A4AU47_9ACTN|nr:PP2C family protein-serine/threonine phosphatase [Bailinhaonella thermotolerans]RJL33075.1 serine/threonine-protein phosphatase [Bailinhaonella thermotolerans]